MAFTVRGGRVEPDGAKCGPCTFLDLTAGRCRLFSVQMDRRLRVFDKYGCENWRRCDRCLDAEWNSKEK